MRPSTYLSLCFAFFSLLCSPMVIGGDFRELKAFDKIVVSPDIELVLSKGEQESIVLETANIDPDLIHVQVKGNTLRIWLEGAKRIPKYEKLRINGRKQTRNYYKDAVVVAYVTYRQFKQLMVRGEERIVCKDKLEGDKFKLKVFGTADVKLASVNTDKLKGKFYGENEISFEAGQVKNQVLKSYGENRVDARHLTSRMARTGSYGESEFLINVSHHLKVNAMGETEVYYWGDPILNKGIVLGESTIRSMN